MVTLSSDFAAAYPTDDAVYDALRTVLRLAMAARSRSVPRQPDGERVVA
jgi:hypothetical protein